MAKKSYREYITKPTSDRILNNISANLDKFIEVMREVSDPSTELSKKNPPSAILSKNLRAHPLIHVGYYDERRNNVLYVCDALDNDKLIEKRNAVLLCDGRFAKNDSGSDSKTIYEPSYVVGHVGGALSGSESERKWCKGRYVYEDSIGLYIPIVLQDYIKAINIGHLHNVLFNTFKAHQENSAAAMRPISREAFDINTFLSFFIQNVSRPSSNSLSRSLRDFIITAHCCTLQGCVEIPLTSPILGGLYIYGDHRLSASLSVTRALGDALPTIPVNDDGRNPWSWFSEGPTLAIYEMGSFPFRLGVRISQSSQSSRASNTTSDNNSGRVLTHNAKVDAYKVGFLMSDEEKMFFDRKAKEYKDLVTAHSTAINKLKKRLMDKELSSDQYNELYKKLASPQKPPQDNPVYLGIEIELVTKGSYRSAPGKAQVVQDIANSKFGDHCILKGDGSLREQDGSDFGLEITTVPATLSHHLKMFDHFFEYSGKKDSPKYNPKALNIVDKLMSNSRCGIHVHIARNCLSTINWGKFLDFMYSPINGSFIDKMAGRPPNKYCVRLEAVDKRKARVEFTKKLTTDGTLKGAQKFQDESRSDLIRRVSVNLQNAHTIEVRIFKSSTDKNNVLRKFEFCDALVHMVQTKDIGLRTFDYFDFINFILEKDNRKKYFHITQWLSSMGMIGHERKRVRNKESAVFNKIMTSYKYNLAKLPPTDYYKSDKFLSEWLWSPTNKTVSTAKAKGKVE